jgi:chemotaxis protein CheD
MSKPQIVQEIYLKPGEHYFSDRRTRIKTILGSCVSVVFWHPKLCCGGMCHFMLPSRGRAGKSLDGRYADEALALLLRDIDVQGAPRREYQVKIFGGGRMFGDTNSVFSSVGLRNAHAARDLIAAHGFEITCEHLGGGGHRSLIFEVWSGDVWMKHVPSKNSVTILSRIAVETKRSPLLECLERARAPKVTGNANTAVADYRYGDD